MSAGFYLFQIYESFSSCRRFYLNLTKIHKDIFMTRDFIYKTIENIDIHIEETKNFDKYHDFNIELKNNRSKLINLHNQLSKITPYKLNMEKAKGIGYLMKCFYDVYDDKDCNDIMLFAFGFIGYIETVKGLNENINKGHINICNYTSDKESSFKNSYYAPFKEKENVSNSYSLESNKLITGPNASGKTTILKTTIFNIILSQQIGFGFYTSANINPYKYIHCYLNIPDTSGRDSLFQAEARRCKEILESVINNTERHFLYFDEIYSGTNPYEAISCLCISNILI